MTGELPGERDDIAAHRRACGALFLCTAIGVRFCR
jgi:hypothetical protein